MDRISDDELFGLERLLSRGFKVPTDMGCRLLAELKAARAGVAGWRTEAWSSVLGYEGRYEISSPGRVRSLDRDAPHNMVASQKISGKILSPVDNADGYKIVGLRSGKTSRRFFRVHRLVAEAFVPNPDGKPCVNHKDNDPSNNSADNLEWCTQAENLAHMTSQGRRSAYWKGKRSPRATLTDEQVAAIKADLSAHVGSWSEIAKHHGVSKTIVGRILKGKTYV